MAMKVRLRSRRGSLDQASGYTGWYGAKRLIYGLFANTVDQIAVALLYFGPPRAPRRWVRRIRRRVRVRAAKSAPHTNRIAGPNVDAASGPMKNSPATDDSNIASR